MSNDKVGKVAVDEGLEGFSISTDKWKRWYLQENNGWSNGVELVANKLWKRKRESDGIEDEITYNIVKMSLVTFSQTVPSLSDGEHGVTDEFGNWDLIMDALMIKMLTEVAMCSLCPKKFGIGDEYSRVTALKRYLK